MGNQSRSPYHSLGLIFAFTCCGWIASVTHAEEKVRTVAVSAQSDFLASP